MNNFEIKDIKEIHIHRLESARERKLLSAVDCSLVVSRIPRIVPTVGKYDVIVWGKTALNEESVNSAVCMGLVGPLTETLHALTGLTSLVV